MAILSKRSAFVFLALVLLAGGLGAQAPAPAAPSAPERGPEALSPEATQSAIDALGAVDTTTSGNANGNSFSVRMNAARPLRRAPAGGSGERGVQGVDSGGSGFV